LRTKSLREAAIEKIGGRVGVRVRRGGASVKYTNGTQRTLKTKTPAKE